MTGGGHLFQQAGPIQGHHDPHIQVPGPGEAPFTEEAVADQLEEAVLVGSGQGVDAFQEKGPAIGLEGCAFFIKEERALFFVGEPVQGYVHEGTPFSETGVVDALGHQAFFGPGFPADQHREIRESVELGLVDTGLHSGRALEDIGELPQSDEAGGMALALGFLL